MITQQRRHGARRTAYIDPLPQGWRDGNGRRRGNQSPLYLQSPGPPIGMKSRLLVGDSGAIRHLGPVDTRSTPVLTNHHTRAESPSLLQSL
jgi:hypothetical protein